MKFSFWQSLLQCNSFRAFVYFFVICILLSDRNPWDSSYFACIRLSVHIDRCCQKGETTSIMPRWFHVTKTLTNCNVEKSATGGKSPRHDWNLREELGGDNPPNPVRSCGPYSSFRVGAKRKTRKTINQTDTKNNHTNTLTTPSIT